MYDVFGIGNPLVDIIVSGGDKLIKENGFEKGSMNILNKDEFRKIKNSINNYKNSISCGDSTANTLVGLSILGRKTIFSGMSGNDDDGRFYEKDLTYYGVNTNIVRADENTGNCISIVTEDTQRTMYVYLGACLKFNIENINIENLKNSKILHFTGYQLDSPTLKNACLYAIDIAKLNKIPISFDLADVTVVDRHSDLIKDVLNNVKIVFANTKEAYRFTKEDDPKKSAKILSRYADIAVVKDGENGSYVYSANELIHVPAFSVKAIDTTGAGDGYASGFLKGFLEGANVVKSAEAGSYFASEIVKIYGSRLSLNRKLELQSRINEILGGI